jgi:hypothetical protein
MDLLFEKKPREKQIPRRLRLLGMTLMGLFSDLVEGKTEIR